MKFITQKYWERNPPIEGRVEGWHWYFGDKDKQVDKYGRDLVEWGEKWRNLSKEEQDGF